MNLPSICQFCSRRHFISRLSACVCGGAGAALLGSGESHGLAAEPQATLKNRRTKPRICVVFCETANDRPIWPNVGYNFQRRRNEVLGLLRNGCPQIEWVETQVMDHPADAQQVLDAHPSAEGYVVCVQGLGWNNDLAKLCSSGKPTLLVDNLFGGSGHFLMQLSGIVRSGKPVGWVSSSRDEDLVAAARQFELIDHERSPAEIAAAFQSSRRSRTPHPATAIAREDPISAPDFEECFKRLRETRILVVGGGWGGDPFAKAAAEVAGIQFVPLDFKVLAEAYEKAAPEQAAAFAQAWRAAAREIVEPTYEEIVKSGAMYIAMKNLLNERGAKGITINCLGGFYGGHIKAYPCLGFCQFNNDGLVGGCEGDQMSAFTMMVMSTLVGRPGFISDPVLDTSRNSIIYAHCVATTRPFGPSAPPNPFRIRSHSEDRKGAAIQSLLPAGYMTTTIEINPQSKQLLMHKATSTGNNSSDLACRTKLEARLQGDIEKLAQTWRMGWHRVTFYGDLSPCLAELAARWNLELVQEA